MTLFWYYRPEQLKCNKKKLTAPPSSSSSTTNHSFHSSSSPSVNASTASTCGPDFRSVDRVDDAVPRCRILSSTRVLKSSLRLNHRPMESSTSVDDITKSKVEEFMNANEVFATKHLDYNSVACIEGKHISRKGCCCC